MKIKKLVAFGCSWTYGDELVAPEFRDLNEAEFRDHYDENRPYRLDKCYAGRIAEHYGLELDNMAFPGSSLESMRWNLMWYLRNGMPTDDVIFVVGLTDATRQSWFNPLHEVSRKDPQWNRHMHGTWLTQPNPDIDDNWFRLQKTWMGMSYHIDWAEYNFQQTINLFDQAQSRYGIPVVQFSVLENRYGVTVPSLIYSGTNFRDILNQKKKDLDVEPFARGGHPNEKGHQLIADHLIEHIKYAKMLV
jgi:hypothetical protein